MDAVVGHASNHAGFEEADCLPGDWKEGAGSVSRVQCLSGRIKRRLLEVKKT